MLLFNIMSVITIFGEWNGACWHQSAHPYTNPDPSKSLSCTSFCKTNLPQNLLQILQIKFLCLQCLSSFLQYIHISDLPLNTIIVHLASNYSNRKTGNHCHSDWKINVAQRYFYSFYGVSPSLDAHTLESQGKFQITLVFIILFYLSIHCRVSRQKYSEWHPEALYKLIYSMILWIIGSVLSADPFSIAFHLTEDLWQPIS